ncbi:MAG: hypothetical protein GX838_00325 [Clostridiaceae bacterium]|nr:hypothetical protein [Clostridiaceae bacterium]
MNAHHTSGKGSRPRRTAANERKGSRRKSRPGQASGSSRVLARFQSIYLSILAITLIFIIVFSFLIKGRINQILGMNEESGRPDYDIFPYHTLMTNDDAEETEEEIDPDETWPDAEDYDLGNLPPVPRVPAAPAQAAGNVTQATTPTGPVTENSSQTDVVVTEVSTVTELSTEPPTTTDKGNTEAPTGETSPAETTEEQSQDP